MEPHDILLVLTGVEPRFRKHIWRLATYIAVEDDCMTNVINWIETDVRQHVPFGRSTTLLVEIIVFAIGERASLWRDQLTKSVD